MRPKTQVTDVKFKTDIELDLIPYSFGPIVGKFVNPALIVMCKLLRKYISSGIQKETISSNLFAVSS